MCEGGIILEVQPTEIPRDPDRMKMGLMEAGIQQGVIMSYRSFLLGTQDAVRGERIIYRGKSTPCRKGKGGRFGLEQFPRDVFAPGKLYLWIPGKQIFECYIYCECIFFFCYRK